MITKFIIDKSVKNRNIEDPISRTNLGKNASFVGIFLNILLTVVKALIGFLTGSISIVADSINNLSDTASSIVSLIGISLSAKPSDEEHPYGHGRGEYLATLIVAAFILFVGFNMLKSSIDNILNPKPVGFSYVLLGILILSLGVKFWMYKFYTKVGKKINSSPLVATGIDSINDVLVTSVVIISFIFSRFTTLPIDGIAGIFVCIVILKNGIDLIREMTDELLGAQVDPETLKEIQELFLSYDEIIETHDLYIHSYGPNKKYASIDAVVRNDANIVEIHNVFDEIEHEVLDRFGFMLTTHMDLIKPENKEEEELSDILEKYTEENENILSFHDEALLDIDGKTHCIVHLVVNGNTVTTNEEEQEEKEKISKYLQGTYGECDYDIIIDKEYENGH